MKKLLLALLALSSAALHAQTQTNDTSAENQVPLLFQRYGYLSGVRLDSIPVKYLQVTIESNSLYINYGQSAHQYGPRVNDKEGNKINLRTENYGAVMNFMDYNGWEYLDHFEEQNRNFNNKRLLFKKK